MQIQKITSSELLKAFVETKIVSDRPTLIGICGYAGAGKTTLCRSLLAAYPDLAHHFICDRFSRQSFREREVRLAKALAGGTSPEAEENPLHWYAWAGIKDAPGTLKTARTFTYERGWNQQTGELDKEYSVTLPPDGPALLLCDCIFLLHLPVRQWLDAVIFVDTPLNVTLDRGRQRSKDVVRNGYMERLTRTYTVPYFTTHASEADAIYAGEPGPP